MLSTTSHSDTNSSLFCPVTNSTSLLRVKKLSPTASLPVRGSPLSAGLDLASAENKVVPSKGKAVVKTDLSIACPPGTYARIAPRSGLAVKKFIDTGAGVVDADYRGNVGVVLFNFGEDDFEVKVGDRIAQLILESVCMANAVEVDDLEETERGEGGFGSTGVGKRKRIASSPVTVVDLAQRANDEKTLCAAELLSTISHIEKKIKEEEKFYERWSKIRPALKKLALDEDKRLQAILHSFTISQVSVEGNADDIFETFEIIVASTK